ncbi:MAG: DNA alkylation repair protein [Patulibacter sp.]|nr:DNA alkylation repair protein [Patulibacter sp.]
MAAAKSSDDQLTADAYLAALEPLRSDDERRKIERRFSTDTGSKVLGVRMRQLFDTAKAFTAMPLDEVERLLDSPYYEARMGAVSILDFRARRRTITDDERRELYDLYLGRHDRIDAWDFVDRAAPRVVGWYLLDKPRDPLFALAASSNAWERRTAITAAFWMIRQGDVEDALALAERLLHDPEKLVNTSVGVALREIGLVDEDRLTAFLREHAATMPAVTLRYASAKLPEQERAALRARRA